MSDTQLQQQKTIEQAKASVQAVNPQKLNPNQGSVVPNVYTQNLAPMVNQMDAIKPPSVKDIHKGMWEGSFMVALMAGLATGNAGAAVTAGLWGSIAIHDHGYTLRQRSQYIPQLQKDGFSPTAILNWYNTGKNDELDKERSLFEKQHEFADTMAERKDESAQRHNEFMTGQENANRRQAAQLANSRAMQAMQIAAGDRRSNAMIQAGDRRAQMAADAAQQSGFKQQAMERRQALMKGATLDADQFKALARSRAAAYKAVADMKQGTPISEQQLELMGQLIDTPNASVKLTQTHHISEGAAHGLIDRAHQAFNKAIGGGDLTDQQAKELLDVINAGHAAQEQAYNEQVGAQASQITDPDEYKNFAIATGLSQEQLKHAVDVYHTGVDVAPAETAPTAPDGNKVMTWAQLQEQAAKGMK